MFPVRLLIICPMLPFPVKAGGDHAVFNMVTELQKTMDVHFLFPSNPLPDELISELKQNHWPNVKLHRFEQKKDWKFYLSRLCVNYARKYNIGDDSMPFLSSPSQYYTPAFLDFIKETIDEVKPDLVQTEFYNNMELVYHLPKDVTKIFIQHEIHYVVNEQRIPTNAASSVMFAFNKLKHEEIAAMNQYDAVLTLTDVDKDKLEKDGVVVPVYSSPAGIAAPAKRNECHFDNKLIFVGPSGHTPNVDGLKWFLSNVWQVVRQKHPEVEFNIVGKWDEKLSNSLKSTYDGINFLGYVQSLEAAYDGAIAIVPILKGSGMRMKIIDAVNMGSPFISTSVGAEGLLYKDGEDCFIEDVPKEFIDKLLLLIEQEDLRLKFYENSNMMQRKHYSIESLSSKRLDVYNIINNK